MYIYKYMLVHEKEFAYERRRHVWFRGSTAEAFATDEIGGIYER